MAFEISCCVSLLSDLVGGIQRVLIFFNGIPMITQQLVLYFYFSPTFFHHFTMFLLLFSSLSTFVSLFSPFFVTCLIAFHLYDNCVFTFDIYFYPFLLLHTILVLTSFSTDICGKEFNIQFVIIWSHICLFLLFYTCLVNCLSLR